MRILIVYATYSGSTLLAAEEMARVLGKIHEVKLINVMNVDPNELSPYDVIILGSCTWMHEKKDGQLHIGFIRFSEQLKGRSYPGKRFAVYGLGDSNFLHFCEATRYLDALVRSVQGTEVVNPLRINRFYFNEDENRKRIREWTEELNTKLQS